MDNGILKWVRPVLEITPLRWLSLAKALPAELVNLPPAEKEWSALGCLLHLLDTERWVFPARVQYLLEEKNFPSFNPDSEGTTVNTNQSFEELAGEFSRLRLGSLNLLTKVKPADLQKSSRHQELGPVTLAELLHEWAAHDLMHTVQAEQALMQPFISGCGPWQVYFRLHDVRYKP